MQMKSLDNLPWNAAVQRLHLGPRYEYRWTWRTILASSRAAEGGSLQYTVPQDLRAQAANGTDGTPAAPEGLNAHIKPQSFLITQKDKY